MNDNPKTAYEQSISAAQALAQTAEKEKTDLEWLMELDAQATKDFRLLFDLRKSLWPPENTVEYWTLVTNKMALLNQEFKEHPLINALLVGMTVYLEEVGKEREKRLNGTNGLSGVSEIEKDSQ